MMTLRHIRYFIAVAETGSISAASQAVFVSQSSLTLAIQQLELDLAAQLFERHAKGMKLTHQGHQFLRQSYLILATVDNARRSLQQDTESLTGKLTIGVTSLVAGYFLVDLFKRFKSVLIIDDLVDSGKTVDFIVKLFKKEMPKDTMIKVAALYYKKKSIVKPDYYIEATTDWIVFPSEV